MDAYSARQLGYSRNRQLYFFACRHDQVGKLVDDYHNVGQVTVSLFRVQATGSKFGIVLFNVAHMGLFQQVVAHVHLQI